MSISNYLKENTIEALENKTMDCPFASYKPLDKGNSKLDSSILSFSLIPVNTCEGACKGCYDLKSFRYPSVCEKRKYNLHMVINEPIKLEALIGDQILKSKTVKAVRIHVGGDFAIGKYTEQYLTMWHNIVYRINKIYDLNIKFYTYTKTEYTARLESIGINVVRSIREDFHFNYDTLENLLKYQSKNPSWFICPVYKENKNISKVKCGLTCTACQTQSKVMFVMH